MDVSIACYFPESIKAMGTDGEVYDKEWRNMFQIFCSFLLEKNYADLSYCH